MWPGRAPPTSKLPRPRELTDITDMTRRRSTTLGVGLINVTETTGVSERKGLAYQEQALGGYVNRFLGTRPKHTKRTALTNHAVLCDQA